MTTTNLAMLVNSGTHVRSVAETNSLPYTSPTFQITEDSNINFLPTAYVIEEETLDNIIAGT